MALSAARIERRTCAVHPHGDAVVQPSLTWLTALLSAVMVAQSELGLLPPRHYCRRAAVVWTSIVPVAVVNGMVRDVVLAPYLGDPVARAISSVTLALAIVFIAWMSIRWIAPATVRAAWTAGGLWLGLTLAFEFLIGHYLFGTSWAALRQDYNMVEGRLWVLVLAATLTAPPIVFLRASPRVHQLALGFAFGIGMFFSPTLH